MNFFQRIGQSLSKFLGSPQAHDIEKAIINEVAPVAEAALLAVSKANPLATIIVQTVVVPAVQAEVTDMNKPPSPGL